MFGSVFMVNYFSQPPRWERVGKWQPFADGTEAATLLSRISAKLKRGNETAHLEGPLHIFPFPFLAYVY